VGVFAALAIGAGIIAIAVVAAVVTAKRERVTGALAAAASILHGSQIDRQNSSTRGHLYGVPVELRLTSRGSGSSSTSWTEVDAYLSVADTRDLTIELRPETRRERNLRSSALVHDIEIGDAAFDEAFVLEAAPAEVMRRLPEARAQVEREHARAPGAPYRDGIGAEGVEAARAAHRDEVARVLDVKKARARHVRAQMLIVGAVIVIVWVVFTALTCQGQGS